MHKLPKHDEIILCLRIFVQNYKIIYGNNILLSSKLNDANKDIKTVLIDIYSEKVITICLIIGVFK